MGYKPFRGRCETCGEIKRRVLYHPSCGHTACVDCWNRAGIISKCPKCGRR